MLLRGTRSRSRRPRVGLSYSHTTAAHPAVVGMSLLRTLHEWLQRRVGLMAQPAAHAAGRPWVPRSRTRTLCVRERATASGYPRMPHPRLRAEVASANPQVHSRSHQQWRITDGGIPPLQGWEEVKRIENNSDWYSPPTEVRRTYQNRIGSISPHGRDDDQGLEDTRAHFRLEQSAYTVQKPSDHVVSISGWSSGLPRDFESSDSPSDW
jgi:hypothetical protein